MVTASGQPLWLTVVSLVIFVVVFAIAARIVWSAWQPEFGDRYGDARGRRFLALFLVSFPAFVVAHLRFRRTHRGPQNER